MIMVQEHLELNVKLQRDSGGENWEHGVRKSTGYMLWEKGTSDAPHQHGYMGYLVPGQKIS